MYQLTGNGMISDERYERQKERQRERYASDPGFRLKQKIYHAERSKAIKEDAERLAMERRRRRLYYLQHQDERKEYQREYARNKKAMSSINING